MSSKACCFCIPVREGCLVLGTLGIIGAALEFFQILALSSAKKDAPIGLILAAVIILLVVLAIFIMLIYGTLQKKAAYLMPYMVAAGIGIASLVIGVIGLLIASFYYSVIYKGKDADGAGPLFFILAVFSGLYALLNVHFFQVVQTHYEELKNGCRTGGRGVLA